MEDLIGFIVTVLMFYVLVLIIQFVFANIDPSTCELKRTKIEYIFPGYRIGCWGRQRT